MTEFELVKEWFAKRNITKYSFVMQPYTQNGERIVWATRNFMELYFIIKDNKIVEVQTD